jgi:hypothetical protein
VLPSRNADSNANADCTAKPDPYSYCDIHGNAQCDCYGDADVHAYSYSYEYAECCTNGNGYSYDHAECYGNGHSYSYCKTDAHRSARRNTKATSESGAATDVRGDRKSEVRDQSQG